MSHRKRIQALLTALLVALGLTGSALAQEQGEEAQPEAQPQQQLEKALATIHAINQLESQVALMAMNHARAERVREYAAKITEDHEELDRRLMKLANQLDVQVAASRQVQVSLQSLQQELSQDLQTLVQAEDVQFDQAFADLMVSSHESAVKKIRQMREQIDSEEAREYMDRALRTFQRHLDEARELQQRTQGQARRTR